MGRGILPRGLSWTDQKTSIDRAETDSRRTRRNKKRRDVSESETRQKAGVSFAIDATINPDFGQVEGAAKNAR